MSTDYLFIYFCLLQFLSLLSSVYRSFTYLVKFIYSYIILFDAIVNRIVFLTYLSGSPLLVCRNTTDFCVLNLDPPPLLNSFVSSNSIFGGALIVFYLQNTTHKQRKFYFFLSNLDTFYFFSLPNFSGQDLQQYIKSDKVIFILFLILEEEFSTFHHLA